MGPEKIHMLGNWPAGLRKVNGFTQIYVCGLPPSFKLEKLKMTLVTLVNLVILVTRTPENKKLICII